ncbi:MAG: hypothetical protein KAI24_18225 [Planctomycetes bacterium]|nr:hypothetical protein [Planctomycetota bacterium]
MQRSHLLVIAVVIAIGAAAYWWASQTGAVPAGSAPNNAAPTSPSAAEPETGGAAAADPATKTAQRDLIAGGSAGSAARGTNVLRVIFEEIEDESAARAKITVATYDQGKQRTARIRESWPSRGSTNEFVLDSYLAVVAERLPDQAFDELKVTAEHPHHLRETIRVPATAGVRSSDGQTVYKVRVQFAEVAFWPELTLAVRDAFTKEHLEDVELRCVPTAYMGLHQQPGTDSPFSMHGSGLSSPIAMVGGRKVHEAEDHVAGIALRPAAGETPQLVDLSQPEENSRGVMVYARAPGYAWGRIVLDLSKGSQRELLLSPSATMHVRFANVQLGEYAKLGKPAILCVGAIRPDGGVDDVLFRQLDETLATEGVRIENLQPGEHTVSVELGHAFSWRNRHVLARDQVELVAGRQHEVVLALADSPRPPELTTLGGVLSFPRFGGEQDVRLWLYKSDYRYGDPDFELSLADMEPTSGALPTWSFRLEGLPVGRYQARLMPFEKNWMFELPSGGRDDLMFVVPKLAELVVETVDARSGERIPLEVIRYSRREELPGRVHHGWSSQRNVARIEGGPGRFRIWAAPGPALLRTFRLPAELGLAHRSQEVDLVPGLQHVRYELGPGSTIKFDFRVNGATLPRDDGIYNGIAETVRPIGHDGRVGYLSYWMLEANKPGLYEITFEGIGEDRFRRIPPRRIEVRAGETTEVRVELERK